MSALGAVFRAALEQGRAAFIPYVMAGYPDVETTNAILGVLHAHGADFVELGIPYGDPLADGPTIANAGVRALANGVDIDAVLEIAGASPLPVVLFTYYNPVLQYGVQRFARNAKERGVAGVIVPDLALEECVDLAVALRTHGVDMPLLVAPSTPPERAREIARASSGFVYVVSRFGVTGASQGPDAEATAARCAELHAVGNLPVALGFGISSPSQATRAAQFADGVIVGSALLDVYDAPSDPRAKLHALEAFCTSIREGMTRGVR